MPAPKIAKKRMDEPVCKALEADVAEQLTPDDIDGFAGGIDRFDDITGMAMRIT